MIPGSGRSPGEGIGYPLQYFWASLVAQMVKNPPAMWETWVQSLSREDPPEEGMATHSSILAWRIPMDRGAWRATVHGFTELDTRLSNERLSTAQHVCVCVYLNPNLPICPTRPFPHCAHLSVLYVSVSIPALHIGSSVPFF